MPNLPSPPRQIPVPLSRLVGAILAAVVEADGHAARATAEFIREVGFVPDAGHGGQDGCEDFGRMRMVQFSYSQPDTTGQLQEITIETPLLSLIPIPLLSVQEAELSFGVEITGLEPGHDPHDPLPRVMAILADSSRGSTNRFQEGHDVDLKLKMEASDVPAGLSQLFNLLGNSMHTLPHETKTKGD